MKILLPIFAAGLLAASPALAQYTGPSETSSTQKTETYAPSTVAAIKKDPKDDQKVILEGVLLKKLRSETYLLSDGTGEIEVEIDDDIFPKEPVGVDTKLRINGEVDTHLVGDPDVDADQVTVIK